MKFLQLPTIFTFLLLAFTSHSQFEYEGHRVVGSYSDFEEGSKAYLYGDKVVFRAEPNSTAKALDTLSIGSEITIVHKTDYTTSLNGLDWNWYKVKVGRKSGYVLSGLIALDRIKFEDVTYLVTIAGITHAEEDYEYTDFKLRARVLQSSGEFYGHETDLPTSSFYLVATDNRGLDGLESMLVIHLYAEACGVDGGEIYLFNNGDRLYTGLTLSHVSDAGAFWFIESVIFPEDKDGFEGIVRYERELGIPIDEEIGWSKSTIHNLTLLWEDGQLTPNVDTFIFEEEEE
jgi:hypothetical protein